MTQKISVKAPARICLFGDHQDYLGLPVIACAINRFIYIEATPNDSKTFEFDLKDLGTTLSIPIDETQGELKPRDYYRSSLRVLAREGIVPDQGFDITVTGDIPINAGISSSSALTVAWITFLLKAFGDLSKYNAVDLGHLAYLAESVEHKESGGRMDQYTSAIGGIVMIDTDKDKSVEQLNAKLPCLLISESGGQKDTLGGLAYLRSHALEAITILKGIYPSYNISEVTAQKMAEHKEYLPKALHAVYGAAILNHNLTKTAVGLLKLRHPDHKRLGRNMLMHHVILSNQLKIATLKIDQIVKTAMEAGAFGAKIIGSGGGGCVCIVCDHSKKEAILEALNTQVKAKSYEVQLSDGAYQLNI